MTASAVPPTLRPPTPPIVPPSPKMGTAHAVRSALYPPLAVGRWEPPSELNSHEVFSWLTRPVYWIPASTS